MKRVYFIYTIPDFYSKLYQPVMAQALDHREDLDVRFAMDSSLVLDTLANGVVPPPVIKRKLLQFAQECVNSGADMIVVGCTAVNTATKELASMVDVPMISVDEPMIQQALRDGRRRIAVLSHTAINAATIRRRLLAEDSGLVVDTYPAEGAAELFNAGKTQEYLACLADKAAAIPEGYDAILLGHISAENVDLSAIPVPIYRTGEACIRMIEECLNSK